MKFIVGILPFVFLSGCIVPAPDPYYYPSQVVVERRVERRVVHRHHRRYHRSPEEFRAVERPSSYSHY